MTQPTYPALLLQPNWYSNEPDEIPLPLPAEAYEVTHQGDRSTVRVIATGEVIYDNGIGPAAVVAAPEPRGAV